MEVISYLSAIRNVHRDVARLISHGLIEKDKTGKIFVHWDSVEIHINLGAGGAKAA